METAEAVFSAGELKSSTMVHVVKDFDKVLKGATTSPDKEYNDQADFGQDNQFLVSFFRQSRYTLYNAKNKYEYETTGDLNTWENEDADDWNGKIGYADEVILQDQMPPIRPNSEYGYYGFLATQLELKPEISKYLDRIVLHLADVDENGTQTNKKDLTLTAEDLAGQEGVLTLGLNYAGASDTPDESGKNQDEALEDGVLTLKAGRFLISYDIYLKDMMGNGEY